MYTYNIEQLDQIREQKFTFGKNAILSLGVSVIAGTVAITESSIPAITFGVAVALFGVANLNEWDKAVKFQEEIDRNINNELKAMTDTWQTE